MKLTQQSTLLKGVMQELESAGIHVTGIYMPSDEADGGLEIEKQYVLQIAPYHDPIFVLDVVESPGEEIAVFSKVQDLIQFLSKT